MQWARRCVLMRAVAMRRGEDVMTVKLKQKLFHFPCSVARINPDLRGLFLPHLLLNGFSWYSLVLFAAIHSIMGLKLYETIVPSLFSNLFVTNKVLRKHLF